MPDALPQRRGLVALLLGPLVASSVLLAPAAPAPARDARDLRPDAVAARAGAPSTPGGVALSWSPAYMSDTHDFTQAEAVAMAERYDLVAAMPIAFQDHVAAMRRANPDLTLLAYANATLAPPASVTGLPEAAFAHDVDGRRITAPAFGTTLMESSNAAWRTAANQQCDDRVEIGGYDGCLVDMLTLGVFSKNYVTAFPKNPATGAVYTQAAYRDQMAQLAAVYRKRSPGLVHVGNSAENAYRYWQSKDAPSRPLVNGQPSAQMEDFLRGAKDAVADFPDVEDWLRNVEVVRDMESQGTVGLFTTKLWVGASNAQAAQWQAYTIATFLMGADGGSFLAFTRSRDEAGVRGTNLPYAMPRTIGLPQNRMTRLSNGAYTRRFGNGMAVVNPGTTTVTVNLDHAMTTLAGRTVTSVTLAPHSGEALVGTSSTPTPDPDDPPTVRDTQAPRVSLDRARGVDHTTLRLGGRLRDETRVGTVRIAVRNERTRKWRQPDGTWGAYAVLTTRITRRTATSLSWGRSLRVRPGRYGVSVVGKDAAGNTSRTTPWRVVTLARR